MVARHCHDKSFRVSPLPYTGSSSRVPSRPGCSEVYWEIDRRPCLDRRSRKDPCDQERRVRLVVPDQCSQLTHRDQSDPSENDSSACGASTPKVRTERLHLGRPTYLRVGQRIPVAFRLRRGLPTVEAARRASRRPFENPIGRSRRGHITGRGCNSRRVHLVCYKAFSHFGLRLPRTRVVFPPPPVPRGIRAGR
jgi:hypothetical protein